MSNLFGAKTRYGRRRDAGEGATVRVIEGFDGTKQIFNETVPTTHITDARLVEMLRALAAKHLSDKELVASCLRRNVKGHQAHLETRRSASQPPTYSCGDNPHFIATAKKARSKAPFANVRYG